MDPSKVSLPDKSPYAVSGPKDVDGALKKLGSMKLEKSNPNVDPDLSDVDRVNQALTLLTDVIGKWPELERCVETIQNILSKRTHNKAKDKDEDGN